MPAWSVSGGALFLVSLAGSSLGREKEISGVPSCKGTNPIHEASTLMTQ